MVRERGDPEPRERRARALVEADRPALEAFLRSHEDTSLFLLSNLRAAGLVDRGERCHATYAGAFGQDGALEAVAAHAWNRSVLLQAPRRLDDVVRAAVSASGRDVGGFVGPWPQCVGARRALGLDREPAQYGCEEDRFSLDLASLVRPASLAEGRVRCRRAVARDLPLLAEWRAEMAIESLNARDSPEMRASYRESALRQAQDDALYVLEDARGAPLSTCAWNGWAPPAAQVGGVYTPPERRGRGHAREVVAGALDDAARRGISRAVLFTGSPAARRAYEAIGFRRDGGYGILLLARSVPVAVEPR
jgi:RimJ/RimL family protein N-acetyltransferase